MTAITSPRACAEVQEDSQTAALERYFARHALECAAFDLDVLGAPLTAWAHRYGRTVDEPAQHRGCHLRAFSRPV